LLDSSFLIIVNFALYFAALIAIQYSATSNKLSLVIIGPSFLITLYLTYYCLSFLEEFLVKVLWIIMTNLIWFMALLLTTPYTYTFSRFLEVDIPSAFVIRIIKDMGENRGRDVYVNYKAGNSYFVVNGFEIGVSTKERGNRSFVDFYVKPCHGIIYRAYLFVILLLTIPMSLAMYYESLVVDLWGISINIAFPVLVMIILTWYLSKILAKSATNNLNVFLSDFNQRLKKVREAAKMLEAAKAAEELLKKKKRKMIEEAVKIAKAISIASEIKEKRTWPKYLPKYLKEKDEDKTTSAQ